MADVVVKQSTTSRTGTQTQAVDPELTVPLAASTVYWVQCNFRGIAGATNDFKYGFNYTGTLVYSRLVGTNLGGQFAWGDNITVGGGSCICPFFSETLLAAATTVTIQGSNTASTHYGGTFAGIISTSTAGSLEFVWAQNTSGGNTATVEAGSSLVYFPITEMDQDFIIKASDEVRSSTTVLTDDAELVLNLEANKKYIVNLMALHNALATPDFKYAIAITGSPTAIASGSIDRNVSTAAMTAGNTRGSFHTTPSAVNVVGADPATNRGFTEYNLAVVMGGSPGVLSFQWAQQTSSPTAITVFAGSYIKYQEVP